VSDEQTESIHPDDDEDGRDRIGEATVHRFIERSSDVIIARADFERLITAYEDHVRRWENQIDGLALVLASQGLGAATLHLSCRPAGETIGWTVNIRKPPTNLFITGDSAQRSVTGRVFIENVKTAESSRMFVQISRPTEPLAQSTVDVTGLDVLEMFDQFYDQSEQTPARFFEIDEREYMMIVGLPDVDEDWLRELSLEEAVELAEGELKSLGRMVYRFHCGCNPDRIMELMLNLYGDRPAELFEGDAGVEVLCPRCGRRWQIHRDEFDRAAQSGNAPGEDAPGEDARGEDAPGDAGGEPG
jgi:molecular chaperone Hsp33